MSKISGKKILATFALAGVLAGGFWAKPAQAPSFYQHYDEDVAAAVDPAQEAAQVKGLGAVIERQVSGQTAGAFTDGKRLDAVFPGGGMAGAVQAAEATALHDGIFLTQELQKNGGDLQASLDALEAYQNVPESQQAERINALQFFNEVFALSSGGEVILFAQDGRPYFGTAIFTGPLATKEFMNVPRGLLNGALRANVGSALGTGHGMEIDRLRDAVHGAYNKNQALDWDAVLANKTSFHIFAMDPNGKDGPVRLMFSHFADPKKGDQPIASAQELSDIAERSCAIMGITAPAREGQKNLYDPKLMGAISLPDRAEAQKADLIFVFSPVPEEVIHAPNWINRTLRAVVDHFVYAAEPDEAKAKHILEVGEQETAKEVDLYKELKDSGKLIVFTPPSDLKQVSAAEVSPEKLRLAVQKTYVSTLRRYIKALDKAGLIKTNANAKFRAPSLWDKAIPLIKEHVKAEAAIKGNGFTYSHATRNPDLQRQKAWRKNAKNLGC